MKSTILAILNSLLEEKKDTLYIAQQSEKTDECKELIAHSEQKIKELIDCISWINEVEK